MPRPGVTTSGFAMLLRGVVVAVFVGLGWVVHRSGLWGPLAVAMGIAAILVGVFEALCGVSRVAAERRRLGGVRLRDLDRMGGAAFEDWVEARLAGAGFTCQPLPRTRDFGIDVVAGRGPLRVGVQAKRYDTPVGNHAVQEAIAGAGHHGCQVAAVVTQSRFTAAAREQARTARLRVVLIDRDGLADLPRLLSRS